MKRIICQWYKQLLLGLTFNVTLDCLKSKEVLCTSEFLILLKFQLVLIIILSFVIYSFTGHWQVYVSMLHNSDCILNKTFYLLNLEWCCSIASAIIGAGFEAMFLGR